MKLHEYQAKEIFRAHGIPVPRGEVARTPEEAEGVAERLGGPVVVKAQVHVGGRGKAGGIALARDPAEAREKARAILEMTIKGLAVRRVLVAEAVAIAEECYAGLVVDRSARRPVLMVSRSGGIDIEEVARTSPEKVHRRAIDPRYGLFAFEALGLGFRLFDDPSLAREAGRILRALYEAFLAVDGSLAEINPLARDSQGRLWAMDAKIVIDDNGLIRQGPLAALRDLEAELPAETQARQGGLSYVKMDGTVGCVVNGAGLAMATMDLIKLYKGEPANFLDIGGSSSPVKVTAAMKILQSDPKVTVILFNIFGGITRCDDVARGIVESLSGASPRVPIVIRLTGTNEREGIRILQEANLHAALSMDEAVQVAVSQAGVA